MTTENKMVGKMIDNKLMNFLGIENELWEDVICDDREGFTEEHQEIVKMMIRKIILNTECGNLHSEDD